MDLEVLRKAPLFTNLDDEVFAILTSELTEVELSRGASAFHEGDQGDQLYVIMSGKIKLGRTASDGRENLVAVLGPGEIFGEMALFNPAPRNATATAVSATRLAGLRHENLRRAIATVSTARLMGRAGWPRRPSSWLRNFMSKAALWITRGASPMNSRNSSAMAAKTGLSRRKSSPRPWTAKAASGMGRSGLT